MAARAIRDTITQFEGTILQMIVRTRVLESEQCRSEGCDSPALSGVFDLILSIRQL